MLNRGDDMNLSARPRVAISRAGLPGDPARLLAGRCEPRVWEGDDPPTSEQLAELVRGCDAALVLGNDPIGAALLDGATPRLKVVALASMGFDAVDVAAAARAGVVVTHTPGILAETTADVAMALILMARRRLGAAVDAMRRGEWQAFRMDGFLGLDVHGATLGIVGFGQIGQALARRAAGFGMTVRHYDHHRGDHELSRAMSFTELLRACDVVSLHVPLTPETAGLIGTAELALMKPTATLINTARGGLVDEDALIAALREGRLHSAGLDVMRDEPRSDPADPLFSTPNLVALPHVGSATESTRARMVELAARNVLAVLDGQDALTPLPRTPARPRPATTT
jgi:glyoxylate reductase